MSHEQSDEQLTRAFSRMLDICIRLPNVLRDDSDRIQALWKTLIANSERLVRPAPIDLGKCFHDWLSSFLLVTRTSNLELSALPEISNLRGKIAKLSNETETEFALPDLGSDQLWWERIQ